MSDRARIFFSTVAVAQLVESRIVIPVVAGSSPVSHPIRMVRNHNSLGLHQLSCALNLRIIGLKKHAWGSANAPYPGNK